MAKAIFDNAKENAELRSLCLEFLPLDDAKARANVKQVYAESHSSQLRFAVEDAFLKVSNALYQTLNGPGGPATSIVTPAGPGNCARPTPGNTAFVMKYRQRQDFHDAAMFARWQYVLTNIETGQRIAPADIRQLGGWSGMYDGEGWFELARASYLPPGNYKLSYEILREGKVVSAGYPLEISVRDASNGRVIVANSSD